MNRIRRKAEKYDRGRPPQNAGESQSSGYDIRYIKKESETDEGEKQLFKRQCNGKEVERKEQNKYGHVIRSNALSEPGVKAKRVPVMYRASQHDKRWQGSRVTSLSGGGEFISVTDAGCPIFSPEGW